MTTKVGIFKTSIGLIEAEVELKNIFLAESKINVNGVNVISPAELADFEKLHHKIFKNITFER